MQTDRPMPPNQKMDRDQAESVAVNAFSYLAQDDERLTRFLDLAGLRPETVRAAAAAPGFLAGVLDSVAGDEALLVDLARSLGTSPERIMEARRRLSPSPVE
jgi:Protein of unknown function (DUF3572)